ncbi:MAG: site-2 protease family protein [Anaerolineae bacterium]|nr:site-2 protease family protein [Anaerolineae bacterium]
MEQEVTQSVESAASDQLVVIARLRRLLADVMRIDQHEVLRQPDEAIAFRGQVYGDAEEAFEQMSQRFADAGYTAWLRDWSEGGHEVIAARGVVKNKPGRVWSNVALFLATVASALYVGAQYVLGDARVITAETPLFDAYVTLPLTHLHWGIPFAATLMGILLAHELSHYFVARRYGSPASLPYFIPMPFSMIGTMGAVIVQRAHMRSRKAMFDIGVAGPLGGLIIAIPLLVLGLALSDVGTPADLDLEPGTGIMKEGDSLLYMGLKYMVKGEILPSVEKDVWQQRDVWLNSVAFAAWAGLLVTMINLIPVGQLDGGHVSYALLGRRAWTLGYILLGAMAAWGGWLVANGNEAGGFWLLWSFLNFSVNRRHPPPLNDIAKLDLPRVALGVFVLVLFILLLMPVPMQATLLP